MYGWKDLGEGKGLGLTSAPDLGARLGPVAYGLDLTGALPTFLTERNGCTCTGMFRTQLSNGLLG